MGFGSSGGGGGGGGDGLWEAVGTDGVKLAAGRYSIYDPDQDARIDLGGGIYLLAGSIAEVLIDAAGGLVELDAGKLELPTAASDPTSGALNGWFLYQTTRARARIRVNGDYWDVAQVADGGSATITSGNTSVTVTHAAGFDPIDGRGIQVWPLNNPTNDPGWWWVSNVGSTQFDINVRSNPGSNANFGWRIVGRY